MEQLLSLLPYAIGMIAGLLMSRFYCAFAAGRSLPLQKMTGISVWLFLLPLLLLAAFRWNVGTDTWHTYTPEYLAMKSESIALTPEEEQIMLNCYRKVAVWELGLTDEQARQQDLRQVYAYFRGTSRHTGILFQGLQRLLIFFRADVQWLYVVTSSIILTLICTVIILQSGQPLLASALFVLTSNYFLSLNVVSQYIAIAFCLLACTFAVRRDPWRFLLLMLLAIGFHWSALVFLPVWFFPRLKVRPIICAAAVIIMLMAAYLLTPVLERAITAIAPAYARYFEHGAEFELIFFALDAAVFAGGAFYYRYGQDQPYYRLWFHMNVVGMIALCFSPFIPYMKRINYYFAAPHFLLLPLILSCEKDEQRRRLMTIAVVCLFVFETIIAVGYLNKNGVLPYHWCFTADRLPVPAV